MKNWQQPESSFHKLIKIEPRPSGEPGFSYSGRMKSLHPPEMKILHPPGGCGKILLHAILFLRDILGGVIMEKKVKSFFREYFMMAIGSLIYSVGISVFLDPYELAPGGVTGLGIIFSYLSGLQTGTVIFLINLPILIFGWWRFGGKFIISTVYVTMLSSLMMNAIEDYLLPVTGLITQDYLIAGATGGTLIAFGMAIVFKNGGTTGGSDILVRALRQKFPHIKTGRIYLITDSMVVLLSVIVFQNVEHGLYAVATIVISNFVLDAVLYRGDGAKLIYVISDRNDAIADRVLKEVDIGATYIDGEGAYTHEKKRVLMIVSKTLQYSRIREIVKQEDKDAFLIVSGASEVFGYGYKDMFMQEI